MPTHVSSYLDTLLMLAHFLESPRMRFALSTRALAHSNPQVCGGKNLDDDQTSRSSLGITMGISEFRVRFERANNKTLAGC